jgi:AraC family transcriptional regulator
VGQRDGKGPHGTAPFRGLEQFPGRGQAGDVGYCIAGAAPYALNFSNDSDVICLLLGDIVSVTSFDGDAQRPLRFAGQSAAFHPRGGQVRVRAEEVRHGFIAFSYGPRLQEALDDAPIGPLRRAGSQVNVQRDALRALAQYALARMKSPDAFSAGEVQSLATLVYLETLRGLGAAGGARRSGLSDREFAAICDFIDAELGAGLSCAQIAAAANLPLRAVADGVKLRTGLSLYRWVTERRLARARHLLQTSAAPISEIALACGFSSQQHLTSVFSSKLGRTPVQVRRQV